MEDTKRPLLTTTVKLDRDVLDKLLVKYPSINQSQLIRYALEYFLKTAPTVKILSRTEFEIGED